ncbi:MAG TPA: VWA domain-containing protein [Candidatus Limnocylindria bacterium]|jgi:hypothetical protein|nr:VWA domain-containing protein [Candidatus Limnocylindria bacterium]
MVRSLILLAAYLLLNLSSAVFVSAQADSCSHRSVSVYVQDSQGSPITGLVPADFEAKAHGKPVKILSITPDSRPHRLLLIVDTTHSMNNAETGEPPGEPPRWRWQIALAQHFFKQNRQKAQIALLIFSKQINDVVDFSQGNAAVDVKLQEAAKGYDNLRNDPTKGTATLHDAILQGLQLFDHTSSADAIYVLSDAVENNTATHDFGAVIQRLIAMEVRLFAVLLQREIGYRNKTAEEVLGPEELSEIARKSGGAILSTAEWHNDRVSLSANANGKATTQETLTRLYQAILQRSLLELELPFPLEKNESFQLKLSDSARHQWKGAQIIYSDSLIGCGSNSKP